GRHPLRPRRSPLLHRRPLCACFPGDGIGTEHPPGGGADGIVRARRQYRAGDGIAARRRYPATWQHTATTDAPIASSVTTAGANAADRADAGRRPLGDRHLGMSAWIAWMVAGLVLLGVEVAAPGAFMMWLGLAAVGTGLVVLATDIGFELQVVTVAVL